MRLTLFLAFALAAGGLAGCIGSLDPAEPQDAAASATATTFLLDDAIELHAVAARANLSFIHLASGADDATLAFPPGVLVKTEEGRLVPALEPVALANGGSVEFLAPYGATEITVEFSAGGKTFPLDVPVTDGDALFSGDLAVELLKVQRDQFPHRSPGMESYTASMAYFAEFFESLGYEVAIEEYAHVAAPAGATDISPASLNNVVATKRGTMTPERYLVFGGHYDVVEQTRDGAFDNTAGTVATMAMAAAFADVATEHTLVFGLWGGEEDGILGSQGWISRHSDLVPFIDGYFNYDVTGLSWPAPKVDPARIVVSAGPDGPVADQLHGYSDEILATWMQVEAGFVNEGVAQGQANGAGVNAQSDHTPFMSRGVPVYFTFTEKVNDVFAIIHSEVDTVDNLTRYALCGIDCMLDTTVPLSEAELEEGEWYLARSIETQLALGFYWATLTDAGHFPVPIRSAPAVGLV